jgi:WD40 repeat protein
MKMATITKNIWRALVLSVSVIGAYAGESSGSASAAAPERSTLATKRPKLTEDEINFLLRFDGTIADEDDIIATNILQKVPPELLKITLRHRVSDIDRLVTTNDDRYVCGYSRHSASGITMWDVFTARPIIERPHIGFVSASYPNATGTILALYSQTLKQFFIYNWHAQRQVTGAWPHITNAAANAAGSLLAIANTQQVSIFHMADESVEPVMVPAAMTQIAALAFTSENNLILCGLHDDTVCVYNAGTNRLYDIAQQPDSIPVEMRLSCCGKFLFVTFSDKTLGMWHVRENKLIFTCRDAMPTAHELFSNDERWFAYARGSTISLINLDDVRESRSFCGHTAAITHLSFNKQITSLLSSSVDGTARIWPVKDNDHYLAVNPIVARHTGPVDAVVALDAAATDDAESGSAAIEGGQRDRYYVTACANRHEVCLWLADARAQLLYIKALYAPEFVTKGQYSRLKELLETLPSPFQVAIKNKMPFFRDDTEPDVSMMPESVDVLRAQHVTLKTEDGRWRMLRAHALQRLASPVLYAQLSWNESYKPRHADTAFNTQCSSAVTDALLKLARSKSVDEGRQSFALLSPAEQHAALLLYDKLGCTGLFTNGVREAHEHLLDLETRTDHLLGYNGTLYHLPLAMQLARVMYCPGIFLGRLSRLDKDDLSCSEFSKRIALTRVPYRCAVSPDGCFFVATSAGMVECYDIASGVRTCVALPGVDQRSCIAWNTDSTCYAVSRIHDDESIIDSIDRETGHINHSYHIPIDQITGQESVGISTYLAFCQRGILVFYKNLSRLICCSVASSGVEEQRVCMVPPSASVCAVNHDGTLLALGLQDGRIFVADIAYGNLFDGPMSLFGSAGILLYDDALPIAGLDFSDDNECLASVTTTGFVSLLHIEQQKSETGKPGYRSGPSIFVRGSSLPGWHAVDEATVSCRQRGNFVLVGGNGYLYTLDGTTGMHSCAVGTAAQLDCGGIWFATFFNRVVKFECAWPDVLTLPQFLLFEKAVKAPVLLNELQQRQLREIMLTLPVPLQMFVAHALPFLCDELPGAGESSGAIHETSAAASEGTDQSTRVKREKPDSSDSIDEPAEKRTRE